MAAPEAFEVIVDGAPLAAELHLPGEGRRRRRPVVLVCAGLPGEAETFDDVHDQIVRVLVDGGVAAATYRSRLDVPPGEKRPRLDARAAVDDAAAVFRVLALRDDLDAGRLGVVGYASGAIVAACLAGRSGRIAALCLVAPVTVELLRDSPSVPPRVADSLEQLEPLAAAAAHDRPTLILHGAADRAVPPEASLPWLRRLENAGRAVERVLIARGDHGFTSVEARVACMEQMLGFFAAMKAAAPAGQS